MLIIVSSLSYSSLWPPYSSDNSQPRKDLEEVTFLGNFTFFEIFLNPFTASTKQHRKQINKQTNKQTNKETYRQTDRQTDRQTKNYIQRNKQKMLPLVSVSWQVHYLDCVKQMWNTTLPCILIISSTVAHSSLFLQSVALPSSFILTASSRVSMRF